MTRTIFVSRHRMTECPSCHAHIQVAADVKQTACAFCGVAVTAGGRDVFALLRDIGQSTTGGIVAAALLGMGLVHCADAPTTSVTKDAEMSIPAPLYGAPANPDATVRLDASTIDSGIMDASDPIPAPEYGLPADDAAVADSGDPIPGPLYGISPVDATVADAQDPVPEPDYGIPPMDDASVVDAGDPTPGPLYGISPVPQDAGPADANVIDSGDDPVAPLYGGAAIEALNPDGEILS